MGKRVESINPLRAASSPSLLGTGLPHPSSDRALSPCIAGFGSCPNSWEALPSNLHNPHVLRPPTWANTLDVDCPHQELPQTPRVLCSAAAPAPGLQSVMTG